MSDFADGIAPQRYPCRRMYGCRRRQGDTCAQRVAKAIVPGDQTSAHWSLDEGRWVLAGGGVSRVARDATPSKRPNPFIDFKQFVDRKWAGLASLPTQARAADGAKQSSSVESRWDRWTGVDAQMMDSGLSRGDWDEALDATRMLLRRAELLTLDVPFQTLQSLFEDNEDLKKRREAFRDAMLAFGGACYFSPDVGDRLPSSPSIFRSQPSAPSWLSISWFKTSPYSPLSLEANDELPGLSERWRVAFTDLMTASMGRSMSPLHSSNMEEHCTKITRQFEPGIDWVLRLQHDGILPPLLPALYSTRGCAASGNSSSISTANPWAIDRQFEQFAAEIHSTNRATAIRQMCSAQDAMLVIDRSPASHRLNSHNAAGNNELSNNQTAKQVPSEPAARKPRPYVRVSDSPPATAAAEKKVFGEQREVEAAEHTNPTPEGPTTTTLPMTTMTVTPRKSAVVVSSTQNSTTTRHPDGKTSTSTVVRYVYDDGTEEYESSSTTSSSADDA